MRRFSAFLCCFILLFLATPCVNASITGWSCSDDGDGAIVMHPTGWADNGNHDYSYSMSCAQYWYPGHLLGDFTTDTQEDPTVRIIEDVSNDTTFDWTDYHITIGMTQNFSFVTSGLLTPANWNASVTAVTAGILPNTNNVAGYVGTINYVMGTGGSPVVIGDDGTFGFKVSFSGTTDFTTEQIPTPEPTTIALLGLGGLALIKRRRA